jgi:hypothetical protein
MPKRIARLPPTFNLVVAGPISTGKTAYLKTLLSQSDLPSSTTQETKEAIARFGCTAQGRLRATQDWTTLNLEVMEKGERLNLTVHDTPGFELSSFGDDFGAEMLVNEVLKNVEMRYSDSLQSESQLVRTKSTVDHHVHLVLYFLHPSSFSPPSRRDTGGLMRRGTKRSNRSLVKSKSSPTLRDRKESQTSSASKEEAEDVDELGVHPTDLRLIKKLSNRVNVLPVGFGLSFRKELLKKHNRSSLERMNSLALGSRKSEQL